MALTGITVLIIKPPAFPLRNTVMHMEQQLFVRGLLSHSPSNLCLSPMSMHTELFGFHLLGLSANPESQDIKKAIKYMSKKMASSQNISRRLELLMLLLDMHCMLCNGHLRQIP